MPDNLTLVRLSTQAPLQTASQGTQEPTLLESSVSLVPTTPPTLPTTTPETPAPATGLMFIVVACMIWWLASFSKFGNAKHAVQKLPSSCTFISQQLNRPLGQCAYFTTM